MRKWPVAQVEKEKRRGAILKHLHETTGGQLTLEMLKMGCAAQGIPSNIDQVENAANWLEDQDLAKLDKLGALATVKITEDGKEVVEGLRTVKGVLDPQGH